MLPLKWVTPDGLSVTEPPVMVPKVVAPEEAKVRAPVVVSPLTVMAAVLVSLTFMSPEPAFAEKFGVFTFRAAAAVPKLPEVLERDTAGAVIVETPVILPLAVVKAIVLVVVLPRVAPLSVMPLPPLVPIVIAVALASVGVILTAVADCKVNAPVVFATVIVIGKAPVPGLYPRLLRLVSPVDLAARLPAATFSAFSAPVLPI